jgi:transposase
VSAFYGAYRADGHGRAAYEPSMMVTLILYAFSTKVRSSRGIECRCRHDVGYRVITGNLVPDHATIARFIDRHQQALGGLVGEVLKLCHTAGGRHKQPSSTRTITELGALAIQPRAQHQAAALPVPRTDARSRCPTARPRCYFEPNTRSSSAVSPAVWNLTNLPSR